MRPTCLAEGDSVCARACSSDFQCAPDELCGLAGSSSGVCTPRCTDRCPSGMACLVPGICVPVSWGSARACAGGDAGSAACGTPLSLSPDGGAATADTCDFLSPWTVVRQAPGLSSLAEGAGRLVAGASDGRLFSTSDGRTFIEIVARPASAASVSAIAFRAPTTRSEDGGVSPAVDGGGTAFVAVTRFGEILVSSDAVTWTHGLPVITGEPLFDVAASPTRFVAVGARGATWSTNRIVHSASGTSFVEATDVERTEPLVAVAYGNGRFVAVGSNVYLVSEDGLRWRGGGTGALFVGVAFGGGRFVAGTQCGTLLTSTDGRNWVELASGLAPLRRVRFVAGRFVILGARAGELWTLPPNGAVPSRVPSTSLPFVSDVAGDVAPVGVGDGMTVIDLALDRGALTPSRVSRLGAFRSLRAVAVSAALEPVAVAVGDRGVIWSFEEGHWQEVPSDTNEDLLGVGSDLRRFVAVGRRGHILVSERGVLWSRATSGTTADLHAVTRLATHWVAVGDGVVVTSPDASTWTATSVPSVMHAVSSDFGSEAVAAGPAGLSYLGADGGARTSPLAAAARGVARGREALLIVGQGGWLWRARDEVVTPTAGREFVGGAGLRAVAASAAGHALAVGDSSYDVTTSGLANVPFHAWFGDAEGCHWTNDAPPETSAALRGVATARDGRYLVVGDHETILEYRPREARRQTRSDHAAASP